MSETEETSFKFQQPFMIDASSDAHQQHIADLNNTEEQSPVLEQANELNQIVQQQEQELENDLNNQSPFQIIEFQINQDLVHSDTNDSGDQSMPLTPPSTGQTGQTDELIAQMARTLDALLNLQIGQQTNKHSEHDLIKANQLVLPKNVSAIPDAIALWEKNLSSEVDERLKTKILRTAITNWDTNSLVSRYVVEIDNFIRLKDELMKQIGQTNLKVLMSPVKPDPYRALSAIKEFKPNATDEEKVQLLKYHLSREEIRQIELSQRPIDDTIRIILKQREEDQIKRDQYSPKQSSKLDEIEKRLDALTTLIQSNANQTNHIRSSEKQTDDYTKIVKGLCGYHRMFDRPRTCVEDCDGFLRKLYTEQDARRPDVYHIRSESNYRERRDRSRSRDHNRSRSRRSRDRDRRDRPKRINAVYTDSSSDAEQEVRKPKARSKVKDDKPFSINFYGLTPTSQGKPNNYVTSSITLANKNELLPNELLDSAIDTDLSEDPIVYSKNRCLDPDLNPPNF